jgi:hypothetical protein
MRLEELQQQKDKDFERNKVDMDGLRDAAIEAEGLFHVARKESQDWERKYEEEVVIHTQTKVRWLQWKDSILNQCPQ